jgi:hypothetical protein
MDQYDTEGPNERDDDNGWEPDAWRHLSMNEQEQEELTAEFGAYPNEQAAALDQSRLELPADDRGKIAALVAADLALEEAVLRTLAQCECPVMSPGAARQAEREAAAVQRRLLIPRREDALAEIARAGL